MTINKLMNNKKYPRECDIFYHPAQSTSASIMTNITFRDNEGHQLTQVHTSSLWYGSVQSDV